MKVEKSKKSSKGITLIALVITIIVLLILAAVSIATLTGENGILTRAQDAKTNTEIAEEKEAIGIAYNGVMTDNLGTGVEAKALENELRSNGYTNATAVDNGDGTITVTFESGRSYTIDADGNISDPEEANIIASMIIVGDEVTTDPPMPNENFEHVAGTDIDSGYVIRDKDNGNEFVWIPVKQNQRIEINVTSKEENITSITLTDPYGDPMTLPNIDSLGKSYNESVNPTINGPYVLKVNTATEERTTVLGVHSLYAIDTTADWFFTEEVALAQGASSLEEFLRGFTLEEAYVEYAKMLDGYEESNDNEDIGLNDKESVEENGGFYIGRYEASYDDSVSGGRVASKKSENTNRTGSSDALEDGMLWNYVSQIEALEKSKEMYTGISTLLTGAAWDRTLGWLQETGAVSSIEIVVDSSTWGNYLDDTFTNNINLINTGEYDETKRNNIYDIAGNVWEWTTEANDTTYRVLRGR